MVVEIDARGLTHQELNAQLRRLVADGAGKIRLFNVYGQRYIGTDLHCPVEIEIHGVPGNDLGCFMAGPRITVYGNVQDGCGNTMDSGEIIVHGHAGDILALSARGGRVFIRDEVGYRAGIHMKEYQGNGPQVVIGGTAQDFLGEYMAGGVLLVLGLNLKPGEKHAANFIGTGMHGGALYLRGVVEGYQLGQEVGTVPLEEKDYALLKALTEEYASLFDCKPGPILDAPFLKLVPLHLRPYGMLYTY